MKQPLPFQLSAVELALRDSGFLIADACGLGKTITAIEIAKAARLRNSPLEHWRCLVTVPSTLRAQWKEVIEDQDPVMPVLISDYIPYDYAQIDGYVISGYPEFQGGHGYKFCDTLWDVHIIDEAHRIKNHKSVSSAAIKKVPSMRRYALTGTPWERTQGDIWSILNFTRPDEFPSFWSFAKEWLTKEDNYFDQFKYGGPIDPAEFGEMLTHYMIRRAKEDVRSNMPELLMVEVPVEMTERQAKAYKQLAEANDIVVEVENKEMLVKNILARITKSQQLSTDPGLLGLKSGSGKYAWLEEFMADHPEPLLIFSRFRAVAEGLARKFGSDLIIGGEEKGGKDFATGKTDICCCTIESVEGVDGLQRAVNAVFLDAHWSTIRMTQAIDRIHRMNIDAPKNIYLLHSCKEDKMVLDAINNKWSESDLIYFYMQSG
jgi:SNF2 family DNA or RNA helicase